MAEREIAELPVFTQREITSIMIGLMLALFLANLDQTIVATSLSTMARDLDGWALMPWVVSAYLVTSTTMTPIYGRLSDLYGRRPVLLTAIGLFVGASVLCALAQTMPQLIAARVLQGIGGGGLRSVTQATVADLVPPRERGRYQAYFSTTFGVATALGPVLGGFFADYLSWHWIFWINIPFGILAFALSNERLKKLRRPPRNPVIDWLGAILILASAVPLLIGVGRVEQAGGWATPDVMAPIGIGILAAVALVWREAVAPEPMLPLRLFANQTYCLATILSLINAFVMTSVIVLVPLDYQLVAGLSANAAGARLIPLTVLMAIASFVVGSLVSWLGRPRIFPMIGMTGMMVACFAIAYTGLGHSLVLDLTITGILGASFGFQINPLTVMVQNDLDYRDTGIGLSCITFFRTMGGAFGVAILSTILIRGLTSGVMAIPGHEILGPEPGLALFHLDQQAGVLTPEFLRAAQATIEAAFRRVFVVAGAVSVLAVVATLFLKEVSLRGRETPAVRR
jgi:EmrB/QacA subfamily drug resistance transporter